MQVGQADHVRKTFAGLFGVPEGSAAAHLLCAQMNFSLSADRRLEVRLEAVNIFNHVNLGFPDSEVGVPGTPNPNAGRITETAFGNGDPQREFPVRLAICVLAATAVGCKA